MTIRTDVPRAQFDDMREYAEEFPGVVVDERYRAATRTSARGAAVRTRLRDRPEQRKEKEYAGVAQGTQIGQSGLEQRYDKFLRGTDGYQKRRRRRLRAAATTSARSRSSEPEQGERSS